MSSITSECVNSVKERIIARASSPNITVEKKWYVRVIIVPDDMNQDAETYLPFIQPLCLLITKLIAVWHEVYLCIILYRKCFFREDLSPWMARVATKSGQL